MWQHPLYTVNKSDKQNHINGEGINWNQVKTTYFPGYDVEQD